ncbi:MAG: NAD-dependent epimerase/dehydratase family protein [Saprospiraceae bacterium]|nr:NAD-dependent epimerase/dehydratase family protein [Saprospiraceae bacterium]
MDKLLIIGGTNFIGRNLVEKLVRLNQYEITIFTRGLTNPNLFPLVHKIRGDRNTNDIQLIGSKKWDYIVDLSCYFPNSIANLLKTINQNIKRYIFISTCSVYDNQIDKSFLRGEDSIIHDCTQAECTDTSAATYGKRKAECERRLQKSKLPFFIIRPSLVYGRYDNTDRFYYWLYQVKKQKEILIPNDGAQPFSVTFVDDLISCIIQMLKKDGGSDVYNVTTTPTLSISKIVDTASKILDRNPAPHYAKSEFLHKEQIKEWVDLPLWLDCDYFTYANSKLTRNLNFKVTDFEVSLKLAIDYYDQLNWPVPSYGLSDQRKMHLISTLNNTK